LPTTNTADGYAPEVIPFSISLSTEVKSPAELLDSAIAQKLERTVKKIQLTPIYLP